jgi:hypothetical protein
VVEEEGTYKEEVGKEEEVRGLGRRRGMKIGERKV